MLALAYLLSLGGFAIVLCSNEWRTFWLGQALILVGLVLVLRAA